MSDIENELDDFDEEVEIDEKAPSGLEKRRLIDDLLAKKRLERALKDIDDFDFDDLDDLDDEFDLPENKTSALFIEPYDDLDYDDTTDTITGEV